MRLVLDVPKSSIFVIQKLALHQNGIEFRLAVYWWHQNQSSYIVQRCVTDYNTGAKKEGEKNDGNGNNVYYLRAS